MAISNTPKQFERIGCNRMEHPEAKLKNYLLGMQSAQ